MTSFSPNSPNRLPPLTRATISRARDGWLAGRDRAVRDMTQAALDRASALARGETDDRANGTLRRWVLRFMVRSLFDVRVENPENIPTEPVVLAANHLSHIDPFLILSEVPAFPYYYILADARTLYNQWWKRTFLRFAKGVIPLERWWKEEMAVIEGAKLGWKDLEELAEAIERDVPDGGSIESMRRVDRAVRALFARGDGLMLFPEGRLGDKEGELHLPLKRGAVIYALRSGVPIVPVALVGTKDLYFRKQLTIRFGEPLHFPPSKRPKPDEVQAAISGLQTALAELLPDSYREPDEPKLFRNELNRMFW